MEPDIAATAANETVQQPALNVGMALREARESQGLSVYDVAERIKFAPKQVEALEANDFAHLPEAPFLRGFVRSYARMLHLDEAALIAALPGEAAKQADARTQAVEVAFPTIQSLRRVNVMWLAGALGVALVLGVMVLLHDSEPSVKPSGTVSEPVALPEAAVSGVANAEGQADGMPIAAEAGAAKAAEPAKSAAVTTPAETSKPVEAVKPAEPGKKHDAVELAKKSDLPVAGKPSVAAPPKIDGASAPAVTTKPPVPLEVLKRRPLHFVFSETTWAEVIDVNGTILLSRTNPAGSEQWVGGPRRAPYDISIARPNTVKLYYKGKEIDLSSYAAAKVARLKVE